MIEEAKLIHINKDVYVWRVNSGLSLDNIANTYEILSKKYPDLRIFAIPDTTWLEACDKDALIQIRDSINVLLENF